ncbi:MAG: PDZ domain-containing protein [Sulfurimonas sp.]|nr:PDZ domain-containing protein [Sulfurimonas sp.]
MLRVFIALNILLLNLFACKGQYSSCKQKITNLNVIQNQNLFIPVSNNKTLIYSIKKPNAKIIKHNPFLNLYLVKSKNKVKYPFTINNKLKINNKFKKVQIGLNSLAVLDKQLFAPALLLNKCCNLEGLITPNGIIQKEYIDNFINSKNKDYSDLGIRVIDDANLIIVNRIDPFNKNMKFKKGDSITHLNNKKVKNSSKFMMEILFAKIGTKFKINIIRDGKKVVLDAVTTKRFGGGAISDTFLEQNGLYFSDNLTIISIGEKYKVYGLKTGDRLIQVNGKKVSSTKDIRKNIDDFKHFASLLFTRNNFQFFVNINP